MSILGAQTESEQTPITVRVPRAAHRVRLPDTRNSITRKNACGNFEFYVTVGFYEESPLLPGEVFVKIAKEGTAINGFCDALAATISIALQCGIPWPMLAKKYTGTVFEPNGVALDGKTHYPSLVHAIAETVSEIIRGRESTWGDEKKKS